MSNEKKRGALSTKDSDFIIQWMDTQTPAWIAAKLRRSEDVVAKTIAEFKANSEVEKKLMQYDVSLKFQLQQRPYWRELTKQFTDDELLLFEHYWGIYIKQFREDVLPTEETQIVDLIKYDILMNRNLAGQKQVEYDVERLRDFLKSEYERHEDDRDSDTIAQLEMQLGGYIASKDANVMQLTKLQSEKNKLFKELKATRDQRIEQYESESGSVLDWLKMMDNIENRRKVGREGALMKLAADKELARLSEYHSFMDGGIDKPILNADTVMADVKILDVKTEEINE